VETELTCPALDAARGIAHTERFETRVFVLLDVLVARARTIAYTEGFETAPGLYLAALLIVTGLAEAALPPTQGTLAGRVVDPSGVSVGGARVRVNATDQTGIEVTLKASRAADGTHPQAFTACG